MTYHCLSRDHARGQLGRSCLPFLLHFALSIWNREVNFAFKFQELFTVKSQLSERRLSETTGLFEDDGQSRLFSLLR